MIAPFYTGRPKSAMKPIAADTDSGKFCLRKFGLKAWNAPALQPHDESGDMAESFDFTAAPRLGAPSVVPTLKAQAALAGTKAQSQRQAASPVNPGSKRRGRLQRGTASKAAPRDPASTTPTTRYAS